MSWMMAPGGGTGSLAEALFMAVALFTAFMIAVGLIEAMNTPNPTSSKPDEIHPVMWD